MRLKIDWTSLIVGSKFNYLFCFVFHCIRGQHSNYKPPGGLYLEGRSDGGVFTLRVWGLIFGGAYTWRGLFSEFYGINIHIFCYFSVCE